MEDEPSTAFETLLRDLADAAMSVTHHDIGETEPEYVHEVQCMERRFRPIILAYRQKRATYSLFNCTTRRVLWWLIGISYCPHLEFEDFAVSLQRCRRCRRVM